MAIIDLLVYPSFYSLVVTGLLLVMIVITTIIHVKEIEKLDYFKKITLLSAIGILAGTHGLLHALFEPTNNKPQLVVSNYLNPLDK